MERDRRGRRRRPDQARGLRPLHPPLPQRWTSRALRVAMAEADWARLEALVCALAGREPTRARAYGATLAHLIRALAAPPPEPGPLDWMDWERRKALRLLRTGRAGGPPIGRTGPSWPEIGP
jgi:Ser/Thr protein kinase RdoA (MazF antagonist)